MIQCGACDTILNEHFLSLGNSPLSNSFLSKSQLNQVEFFYPLNLYFCPNCFLVQLEKFETAEKIFSSDYAYFSSYSKSWLEHCEEYADMVIERLELNPKSFVMEIASNDGYLLQYFKERNIPILGVEPTSNTANVAIEKGIPTDIEFFNTSYAKKLSEKCIQADLIIGNNVLAHNPELKDFVKGLKIALKPDGVITIEFPHLLKLINQNQFDTVYHEHFYYFSFHAVDKLFSTYGLKLFDVEEIPTHGGSLRIFAKHEDDKSKLLTNRVNDLIEQEKVSGMIKPETFFNFAKDVKLTKWRLLEGLINIKKSKAKIVGYGAPAKGNTLLNYCGIRTDFLDYTVDKNPHKQKKFLPGTHIPIKHPNRIKEDKPDYVLILPWNLKNEIIEQLSFIHEWGGKFIIPIPFLEVI